MRDQKTLSLSAVSSQATKTTTKLVNKINPYNFSYHSIKSITSPEDQKSNRRVYVGQAPLSSILELKTNDNVRDYLLEAEGKKRKVPTQVHRAISDTLENNPSCFSVLNGGLVIVSRESQIDEKNKIVLLEQPSIINGSQTQGIIKDLVERVTDTDQRDELLKHHIKFELIVTDNEDLIADISIARNFQNDVLTISIAGRRGHLDELEEAFCNVHKDSKLQKSETKLSEDYVKTEKLIQVMTALIPKELWSASKEFNKVYAYNMKTKCLKEFQDIYIKAKKGDENALKLYQFYLDIVGQAWQLYEKWKAHNGFEGTRLQCIEREGGKVKEVPDGIIFPIMASLSAFAKIDPKTGKWSIKSPSSFSDEELIRAAKTVYQDIAKSTPSEMGKSKACYSALYQITEIYEKLSKD